MDFVFDHQAQPFPFCNLSAVGRLALGLQIFVGELSKDLHGFHVQAFHESDDVFIAVREFFAVSRVAARSPAYCFRPHESFRYRDMP